MSIDPRTAQRATDCPNCQREQRFGYEMRHTTGGLVCETCGHFEPRRSHPLSVDPFAEREARREIRECWREDASRRGRDVPDSTTGGGDATGRAKTPTHSGATVSRGIRMDLGPLLCVVCDELLRGGRRRYCSAACERVADAERKRRERQGA